MVVSVAEMSKMLQRSPSYDPFMTPAGRPIEGLTTTQMGAHLGISAKDVGRIEAQYGKKAVAIALHQVGRKLQGRRMGFYEAPREYHLAYKKFMAIPKVGWARDIAMEKKFTAIELKKRAIAAGFPTAEEYVGVRRQLFVTAKPARVIKRVPLPIIPKPPIPEVPVVEVPVVKPPIPERAPLVFGVPTAPTPEEIKEAERLKRRHFPIQYAKEKIEVAKEKLGAAAFYTKRWITEYVDPATKAARIAAEKAFDMNEKSVKLSDDRAAKIESKAIGHKEKWEKLAQERPLTSADLRQEEKERLAINQEIKRWQDNAVLVEHGSKELRFLNQTYEITKKAIPLPVVFLTGVVTGFVTAPIGVARLGLAYAVSPKVAVEELAVGIRALPGELIRRPFEMAGEIVGAVGFFQLAGAGISAGIKRAAGLMRTTGLKTTTGQSFSVTKAIQVGKRKVWIAGKERTVTMWRVEGKLLTTIKQAGKKTQLIETKTFSEVILAPTREGAIKTLSDTWSGSYRLMSKGIKGVKAEISITRTGGRTTFSPTSVERIMRGRAAYSIKELQRMKVYMTKKGIKYKGLKPAPPYEALADIWAKELAVKERFFPITRRIPGKMRLIARGKEYYLSYDAIVDIFGKKKATTLLELHARGMGRAFVPEEMIVKIGKASFEKLKLKGRIPWEKRAELFPRPDVTKITGTTPELQRLVQIPKLKLPPEPVVKVVLGPEVKAVGRLIAKRVKLQPGWALRGELLMRQVTLGRITPAAAVTTLKRLEEEDRLRPETALATMTALSFVSPQALAPAIAVTPALRVAPRLIAPPAPLVPPTPPVHLVIPTPPPGIPPIYIPRKLTKKEIEEEKRRKRLAAKLRVQALAYQASVGAAITGVKISAKEAAKIKRLTGLELRPVVVNPYTKELQKQQQLLVGPAFGMAKKGSPTKAIKMLRAQQEALVAPAWGGRAKHRKTLKKQAQEILKRMKMYAKKTKPVRLKIPKKKKTKREELIQRINKLFA